jgi:hypothetical protein
VRTMKFSRVWLLSNEERRALMVTFKTGATLICGGNGFGKSALLKSLYDAFGAEPYRIDQSWRNANVITAVDFEVQGEPRTILKFAGTYTVFDSDGQRTFQTASVMQGLAPYIADLLDFRLLMADQQEQIVTPPPAYAFAPYYVDQDHSWSKAWDPFVRMYLPDSASALAAYHLGLKAKEYYVALAERNQVTFQMKEVENRVEGLRAAIGHLRQIEADTPVYFNLEDYKAETDSLLAEARRLHEEQVEHRAKLVAVEDERSLWAAQTSVTGAALRETETVFASAMGYPQDIECPTCGEHYQNDIAARFNMAADVEALIAAHHAALARLQVLDAQLERQRSDLDAVASAITRVQAILSIRRDDLSLGEIVAAEGRNAATRVLRGQITGAEQEIGSLSGRIKDLGGEMRRAQDRKRSEAIRDQFVSYLIKFGTELDVRIGDVSKGSIARMNFARGSEGPRGLAAYYYACLHTIGKFGSSTFCPIVIDAPNQQGQDIAHLPAIIKLLVEQRPLDSQLILGVEEPTGLSDSDANILMVGQRRNQLLSEADFEPVSEHLKPLLVQLI